MSTGGPILATTCRLPPEPDRWLVATLLPQGRAARGLIPAVTRI